MTVLNTVPANEIELHPFEPLFAPIFLGQVVVHNRHHGDATANYPNAHVQYVGRPTELGNPFIVGQGYERGEAAEAYLPWLREQCGSDTPARRMVLSLAERVLRGQDVVLVCSCAPAPCHADHIRTAVLAYARLVYTENATGHRPDKLGGYNNPNVYQRLVDLCYAYQKRRVEQVQAAGIQKYRSVGGLAQGLDSAWTEASIRLRDEGHPVVVCVIAPYPSQRRVWKSFAAQAKWSWLVGQADQVMYTSEKDPRHKGEAVELLHRRNRDMVMISQRTVALYDGTPGGTYNCVRYAQGLDPKFPNPRPVMVANMWASWIRYGVRTQP